MMLLIMKSMEPILRGVSGWKRRSKMIAYAVSDIALGLIQKKLLWWDVK